MYGYLDENGNLKQPPAKLKNVPRMGLDGDGNPVLAMFQVGYDPDKEPEQDVKEYLLGLGYFPVVETERPKDGEGYRFKATYAREGDTLVQSWERVDDPAPDSDPEISAERALGIILTGRDSDEAE